MLPVRRPKPIGRKSLYKAEYNEIVITLGKQGKSLSEIALVLNIDRKTLYQWEADFPEFGQALARARTFAQAWWERKAQTSLGKKHFQAQLWRYSMAGRFKEDYADNSNASVNVTLDLGGAIAEIEERRRPAGKVTDVIDEASSLPAPLEQADKGK